LEVSMAYNGYCMGGPLNGQWKSCDTNKMYLATPVRKPIRMIDDADDLLETMNDEKVWYEHTEAGQQWVYRGTV